MSEQRALVQVADEAASLAAEVVVKGDLRKLTDDQKARYIVEVCKSLGLNPLTRPFELIILNGKEVLYPTKGATDQLRKINAVSVTRLEKQMVGDLYEVIAHGRDASGREDEASALVNVKGVTGDNLAIAMMKCETKAKRRLTLSLVGLGWLDESEVEDLPPDLPERPKTLAAAVEARQAAIDTVPMFPEIAIEISEPEPEAEEEITVEVIQVPEPEPEPEGEPIVLDDSELRLPFVDPLRRDVEEDPEVVERAFRKAARQAKVSTDEIATTARQTFPGVPSSAYKARHWRALAKRLGLTLE